MGRWQILGANPRIVCDTGHNEAGIQEVVAQLARTPCEKLHMVIGMVNDKDIMSVLARLPKEAVYYFTKASMPRAMDETQLMKMASLFSARRQTLPNGSRSAGRRQNRPPTATT